MIPESEWHWIAVPMHYVCAGRCLFRLATRVGDYIISSIGDFHDSDGHKQSIGLNRFYETFVFRRGLDCPCGCGEPGIDNYNEIESRGYTNHKSARDGHMELCYKYAKQQ